MSTMASPTGLKWSGGEFQLCGVLTRLLNGGWLSFEPFDVQVAGAPAPIVVAGREDTSRRGCGLMDGSNRVVATFPTKRFQINGKVDGFKPGSIIRLRKCSLFRKRA
eukprot:TRINITY_DN12564_c0_g2_i1.p3 TRINITY_DN12564_c0_g2~~TRINITY_DN12564_c0_g2_i1.p3  ORF type:complete len:107 (+),score=6.93 TRINITY_DN12564_c0_g2_i1:49-369(+)